MRTKDREVDPIASSNAGIVAAGEGGDRGEDAGLYLFDHDQDLKILLGRAKNLDSPFEIADWSVKYTAIDHERRGSRLVRRRSSVR